MGSGNLTEGVALKAQGGGRPRARWLTRLASRSSPLFRPEFATLIQHPGLVLFEALDFGLHVLEAGLFGGEGGFFWFRLARRGRGFRLLGGWLGRRDGFDWVVCLREAQGL